MDRCVITELLPDECACPSHRNIREEGMDGSEGGRVIAATKGGTCRGCLVTKYKAGDMVSRYSNGWLLASCECNEVT